MRLIDADELKSWLNGFIETDNISPTYIRTLIDNQPTVEAIPIEWIEEWGRKNGMSESMSLRVMIEDWEKENADFQNKR